MNPNSRKPGSSRSPGNSNPSASHRRPPPSSEPESLDEEDWFDADEFDKAERARSVPSTPPNPDTHAKDAEEIWDPEDEDEVCVAEEVTDLEEDDEEPPAAKRRRPTREDKPHATEAPETPNSKTFFETLGDGLRTAGETAQRYTHIGVNRAGLEKLRYDLRTAHAELGELAMRCWADAPDVGLTARDPAIVAAVKRVKFLRHKIREKQAKIAELKKGSAPSPR